MVFLRVLIFSLVFSFANSQSFQTSKIVNGDGIDANHPAGNIAVFAFMFPKGEDLGGACSASVVTEDWIVFAAHCIEDYEAGDSIFIIYTNTTGKRTLLVNSTIAETYMHPDFDPELIASPPLRYGVVAGKDFGMARLSDPFPATCELGFDCNSGTETANVPMNAIFAYDETSWLRKQDFIVTGYGLPQSGDSFVLRKGDFRAKSRRRYRGTYWTAWSKKRLFRRGDAATEQGDSGSPWLMEIPNANSVDTSKSGFAVVGITSGGLPLSNPLLPFGFQMAYRLTEGDMNVITKLVESSGGSCTKQTIKGKKTMTCSNPSVAR